MYYVETRLKNGWHCIDYDPSTFNRNEYASLYDAKIAIVRLIDVCNKFNRAQLQPSEFRIINADLNRG